MNSLNFDIRSFSNGLTSVNAAEVHPGADQEPNAQCPE